MFFTKQKQKRADRSLFSQVFTNVSGATQMYFSVRNKTLITRPIENTLSLGYCCSNIAPGENL